MDKKIKMLVIPSDSSGVGKFRSVSPHTYIAEHYSDEFDVDIMYLNDLPRTNLEDFFKQYDLIHIHKQLDKDMQLMGIIKFLSIPVIVDVDDYYYLGNDHPMSISARKEQWHVPIIKHLEAADYVSTTTPIFAKELKKHNKNVLVFPNAIDPTEEQYSQPKIESNKLRVGLVCGSSHLHDIELMKNIASCARPDTNVQLVLCGFDTNGVRTIYHTDTGQVERRPIFPQESVWFEYEKLITDNYKYISKPHKDFLLKFMKGVDDPFTDEPYRRMWTRDINHYATHYSNINVLLAPLKENDFNKMKSQLKEIEAGFTHTALIAQNFGAYTLDLTQFKESGGKINENGTALLVDSRKNHKDWKKDIDFLAANPEYVKKLQDNLYNLVKDKYSLETVCKQRVEAYKKIVADSIRA
jgi:glycosyltransferase involved in cell wall biosynthesis